MPKLSQTAGISIAGVKVDDNEIVTVMSADQLFALVDDPRRTEKPKEREEDPDLEAAYEIREHMQRLFQGAKARNVGRYANYVVELHEGKINGMTPAVILYSEKRLPVEEIEGGDGFCFVQVPWGAVLTALDGETQVAARYQAKKLQKATASARLPLIIVHGRSTKWARQSFHDLNLLSVRPNPAVGLSMDERDFVTSVAMALAEGTDVLFFRNRVELAARQLLKGDKVHVLTLPILRGAVATFAAGMAAVGYGNKPVPREVIEPIKDVLYDRAVQWFTAVTELLQPFIEDRHHFVTSTPPVMNAIGAVGHPILGGEVEDPVTKVKHFEILPEAEVPARLAHQLDLLRGVAWEKGDRWAGIAGKRTAKGGFSVAGPKEATHAVYTALMDRSSAFYRQVHALDVPPVPTDNEVLEPEHDAPQPTA